jgi:hypothetical protein
MKCPRFNHCSAPLCPIDPVWRKRAMLKNERVCHYLTEVCKAAAFDRYINRPDAHIYLKASEELEAMRHHSSELRRRLDKSSTLGSRIPTVRLTLDFDD